MEIIQKEAEEYLKAYWNLNDTYPLFVTCVEFDHASPPTHNLEECIKLFNAKLSIAFESYLKDINLQIEKAEEDFNDELKKDLLLQRKNVREKSKIDSSNIQNIDDLIDSIPAELKVYFK